jgi:2-oxoglutarate dehydrogenase E1 component
MYTRIKKTPSPRESYVKQLISQGELEAKVARELEQEFKERLELALEKARAGETAQTKPGAGEHFSQFRNVPQEAIFEPRETHVSEEDLRAIGAAMTRLPDGFKAHKKVSKLLTQRRDQIDTGKGINWGTAEMLTYGSLLWQGIPCRLSGQDVKRGTFSHRHAVVFDMETGKDYIPLNHMKEDQEKFAVYNSHLSELAVLGFEFGYSLAKPRCLVIWEAQFGDFCNGAQILIDQFIVSSEWKWNRVSNLVMFLPHGYEGQGPEHSSARLERFLQMCARNNIQVANLTTPAQLFHILRRQVLRDFRKPLVLMTPKSLLRAPECVSSLDDFSQGSFQEIIDDPKGSDQASRLLLCSGKIYYELEKRREETGAEQVAIVRVEQLYPFHAQRMEEIRKRYDRVEDIIWVQEEPRNMGAWSFIEPLLRNHFGRDIRCVARDASPSPAAGSLKQHQQEQKLLIESAFGEEGMEKA